MLEVDVLVAMALGLSIDDLISIYRTQFPVLFGYDRKSTRFDAQGRVVPYEVTVRWRSFGDRISEEDRTATNGSGYAYSYELPFIALDREAGMRQAYTEFERRSAERA